MAVNYSTASSTLTFCRVCLLNRPNGSFERIFCQSRSCGCDGGLALPPHRPPHPDPHLRPPTSTPPHPPSHPPRPTPTPPSSSPSQVGEVHITLAIIVRVSPPVNLDLGEKSTSQCDTGRNGCGIWKIVSEKRRHKCRSVIYRKNGGCDIWAITPIFTWATAAVSPCRKTAGVDI